MEDLETKRLYIRKFKVEDTEKIYANLRTIVNTEDDDNDVITKPIGETDIMINSSIKGYELGEFAWAIEEKQTKHVIGYIKVGEISLKNKICKLKFKVGKEWANKGLIEEAIEKVIQYLFNTKDFCTIVSKFYDGNEWIKDTKTRILKNVGMKQEAILRNRKINAVTGKVENLIIFSILKEEMNVKAS